MTTAPDLRPNAYYERRIKHLGFCGGVLSDVNHFVLKAGVEQLFVCLLINRNCAARCCTLRLRHHRRNGAVNGKTVFGDLVFPPPFS